MINTLHGLDPADEEEYLVYAVVRMDLQVRVSCHPSLASDPDVLRELVKEKVDEGDFEHVEALSIEDVDHYPVA